MADWTVALGLLVRLNNIMPSHYVASLTLQPRYDALYEDSRVTCQSLRS